MEGLDEFKRKQKQEARDASQRSEQIYELGHERLQAFITLLEQLQVPTERFIIADTRLAVPRVPAMRGLVRMKPEQPEQRDAIYTDLGNGWEVIASSLHNEATEYEYSDPALIITTAGRAFSVAYGHPRLDEDLKGRRTIRSRSMQLPADSRVLPAAACSELSEGVFAFENYYNELLLYAAIVTPDELPAPEQGKPEISHVAPSTIPIYLEVGDDRQQRRIQ